ncbi:MAG TPA: LptA/OstA family protein [Edaphobacter sp.]
MRVSVERLRIWLLAGACLLVLVVVGFLGLARWRAHHFLTELPGKLGVDVRQETNGFTYSQSVKGRTIYTLHAAKAIQHKDGKYTLRDVGVAVYGHEQQGEKPAAQNQNERVDRIYGKEFDLDQAAGVVKAVGEVHLDLQAPAAKDAKGKMDYAAGKDLKAQDLKAQEHSVLEEGKTKAGVVDDLHEVGRGDSSLIHVKTSNLVYLQKLGVAASDEEIEFEYNGLTGHAKGAEYNADSGILRLQAAVKVSGVQHGKPILLTASQADLDRMTRKVILTDAEYLTVSGEKDSSRARQVVKARHAVVLMREGGGIERINGESGVTVMAGEDTRVSGDRGEAFLNDEGRPVNARIWGNVKYAANDETRHGDGSSSDAHLSFDREGHADKVVLGGGVHMTEQVLVTQQKADAKQAWSTREINAATVEMSFDSDAAGHSRARDAKATGNAKLRVTDPVADGKGQRTSSMAGDLLTARFKTGAAGASQLDEVKGNGSTVLERIGETGVQETSTGDELDVRFSDAAKAGGSSQVASAVQQGHVVVTRHTPAKGESTSAQTDKATAEKATYDGSTQLLTLSGQVQLANADGVLWAERMVVQQKTGDAAAEGGVKASLRQGTQQEAVHVLAQRAEMKKVAGTAIFHGASGTAARLWQGSSQVEAPVLEFNQKQRTLFAHGEGAGSAMAVRTVMVRSGNGVSTADEVKPVESKTVGLTKRTTVVRIASREMRYSDVQREAEFLGGVRVESVDGVMKGDRAVALLESAGQKKVVEPKGAETASFMAGGVERVTLTGQIEITQPGRRATGEKLVYTAGDGLFVLTGSPGAPPRVVDQARGMVTGVELSFRASDESVVISNGEKGGSGPRVHTETRVKKNR